jgi:hypothetical protein
MVYDKEDREFDNAVGQMLQSHVIDDYGEEKLSVILRTRIFEDIDAQIMETMRLKINRGRWVDKSHFVRCAIIEYLDYLNKPYGMNQRRS